MNLKDLFDHAENGVLTYEQLMAAAPGAKFVDLADGAYVAKQKYTDDLAARDTRINTLNDTLTARDTDLQGLRTQLEQAGTDSAKLGELTTNLSELQKKYDKDTKAYERQLREQAYKYAVTDLANQQKFTSGAAKRDFVSSLLAKNLQMEGDSIIGATDFIAAYTKDNADAFVVNEPNDTNPPPQFAAPTNPNNNPNPKDESPFQFNFVGVRPH